MKLKVNILILFLAIVPFKIASQEVIDTVQYRAVYEYSYKTNPDQTEFYKTDLMYLDIGQSASRFYSRYQQIRDSISSDELAKNVPAFEINEKISGLPRGIRSVIYRLGKENKIREYASFSLMFAFYDEDITMLQWKIEDDVKTIAGYSCNKATAHFLGREWTVYYSPEIPINQGPWKLWGLPGLILEATDSDNYFNYKLTGFENIQQTAPISLMTESYIRKKYEQKSKKTFRHIQKLYHTDNAQFMEVFLGIRLISSTNADGTKNRKKVIPYIPLEPW